MTVLVYRIQDEEGIGPFNSDSCFVLRGRTERSDGSVGYGFNPRQSWNLGDSSHYPVYWILSTEIMIETRRVGCLSADDLRHWFNQPELLEALHERGYRLYILELAEIITSDKSTRQCLFDCQDEIDSLILDCQDLITL